MFYDDDSYYEPECEGEYKSDGYCYCWVCDMRLERAIQEREKKKEKE